MNYLDIRPIFPLMDINRETCGKIEEDDCRIVRTKKGRKKICSYELVAENHGNVIKNPTKDRGSCPFQNNRLVWHTHPNQVTLPWPSTEDIFTVLSSKNDVSLIFTSWGIWEIFYDGPLLKFTMNDIKNWTEGVSDSIAKDVIRRHYMNKNVSSSAYDDEKSYPDLEIDNDDYDELLEFTNEMNLNMDLDGVFEKSTRNYDDYKYYMEYNLDKSNYYLMTLAEIDAKKFIIAFINAYKTLKNNFKGRNIKLYNNINDRFRLNFTPWSEISTNNYHYIFRYNNNF